MRSRRPAAPRHSREIAAVFIARSDQLAAPGLHRGRLADNPYAIGDEGPIDLFELGDEPTVKGIFETDVTLVPPLSHVHALPTETPIWRVVRSRSWSARCSRSRPATPVQC